MANFTFIIFLVSIVGFLGKEVVNNPVFLQPSEEVISSVFDEIADTSGFHHWYIDMSLGENWCWKHNIYEIVAPDIRISNLDTKKKNN